MKNLNFFKVSILSLIFSICISNQSDAQCPVTAYASPSNVICGATVNLTAVAAGCKPLNNNFNGGDMTMGGTQPWASTNGANVENGTGAYACVGPPAEGAYSVWMGTTIAAPRSITTNAYDMTICSATTATICFDMKYGTQAGPSPCEGIDLPAEGVSIQYNTGSGWVTLQYWDPNGGYDAVLTTWNRYCISLPPAAMTTGTQFRWYQSQSSGAGFDAWGLDNMVLNLNTPGYTFDWAHDAQAPANSPTTPAVNPTSNTTYTVTYTNGVETCSSPVTVTVIKPTVSVTASPNSFCPGAAVPVQLEAESSIKMNPPTACAVNADVTCPAFSTISDEQQVGAGVTTHTYNNTNEDVLGDFGVAYMTTQILFKASELAAAGIVAGKINSLSLDVQRIETSGGGTVSSVLYPNIKIAMGCTALTAMTATYIGGLTQVYSGTQATVSTGWSPFFFNQGYEWDGTSNIIVQICIYWNGTVGSQTAAPNGTGNYYAFLRYNSPGYNCSVDVDNSNFSIGACSTDPTFAAAYNYRPNVKFGFCKPSTAVLTYSWTSSPAGFTSSIYNPTANPTANTTYTVAVNQTGMPAACAATANTSVTVKEIPTVVIAPNPVQICAPATTASLSGSASNSATSFVATTFPSTGASAIPEGNTSCTGTGTATNQIVVGGASPMTLGANPIQAVVINMNPCANISDYEFYLISPNGTQYFIINRKGNSGGNTTFTIATGGAALPATGNFNGGTYAPAVAFPTTGYVNGTWGLKLIDKCKPGGLGSSTGTVASWSIKFNAPNNITSYSWSPATNLSSTTTATTTTSTTSNRTYTMTATASNGCANTASINVVMGCALPVELTDFGLSCKGEDVNLKWDISSELNNDYFTIEKSFNGLDYTEIAQIDGAGNSSSAISYNFIDKKEKSLSNYHLAYYRLSQTDFDGKREVIAEKMLEDCGSGSNVCINTYPNPVDNYVVVVSTTGIKNKSFELVLHDMLGKLVFSKTITPESDSYNLSVELPESLQKGIYLISSKGANNIQFCEQKIVVQ